MGYVLAVDFGTTATAAAVAAGTEVQLLEFDRARTFPSLVVLGDEGRLTVGRTARAQAGRLPGERVLYTPKRTVGGSRVPLGDRLFAPAELVAAVLGRVRDEAARRFGGQPPTRLVLTHPAGWASDRTGVLAAAAERAELPAPQLVPEPVAAAVHYVNGRGDAAVSASAHVAVYDLGGGTFDVAVLRRTTDGFEVAGPPGGDQDLGGEDFDERLRSLVGEYATERDAEGWAALQAGGGREAVRDRATLRREVREAKEILSEEDTTTVYVPDLDGDGLDVRLTRRELNRLIQADLERTVALLRTTVADAGLTLDDLAAVYLTGGSSRIPLVSTLLGQALGHPPSTWDDPKCVVALGAARWALATEPAAKKAPAAEEAPAAATATTKAPATTPATRQAPATKQAPAAAKQAPPAASAPEPAGSTERLLRKTKNCTMGALNPGELRLTDRRLTFRPWMATQPTLEIPLTQITGVSRRDINRVAVATRAGPTHLITVSAFSQRAWIDAIMAAARACPTDDEAVDRLVAAVNRPELTARMIRDAYAGLR